MRERDDALGLDNPKGREAPVPIPAGRGCLDLAHGAARWTCKVRMVDRGEETQKTRPGAQHVSRKLPPHSSAIAIVVEFWDRKSLDQVKLLDDIVTKRHAIGARSGYESS